MNLIHSLAVLLVFQMPFACNEALEFQAPAQTTHSEHEQKSDISAAANIVFKSADGGQTWQDISEGLPKTLQDEYGDGGSVLVADDNGLWLGAGNGIYHGKQKSTAPFWTKENGAGELGSIAPGKAGIFAFNYQDGGISQKTKGTGVWSPVFTSFQGKQVRSVFETDGGTLFIGSDRGFYRSKDKGKSWKQLPDGGWGKMVEANGVLLVTSQGGILRSTDDGESWTVVISEGGVGIDVERIKGGFAAITYSTVSNTRRIRASYDGGKTWNPIDAGLREHGIIGAELPPVNAARWAQGYSDSTWHPNDNTINSAPTYLTTIIQVGESFFCGHTYGIYRSQDKGKTWKLVLPAVKGKMFKLSVSGNVIYAVQTQNHC